MTDNVSLGISITDNATGTLKNIQKTMDSILKTAESFAKVSNSFPKNMTFGDTQRAGRTSEIKSLTAATKGLYDTQRRLNLEMKNMPDVNVDTTRVRRDLDSLFNSLRNVQLAQQFFLRNAQSTNLSTGMAAGFKATENAIDSANLAYKRLQTSMKNDGTASIKDVKATFDSLEVAMKQVHSLQSQINRAMTGNNSKEEVERLKFAYETLSSKLMNLTSIQNQLIKSTDSLEKETLEAAKGVDKLNNELTENATVSRNRGSSIGGLTSKLKTLAGAYIGVQSAAAIMNSSDSLVLSEAKLSNLTDDVDGLMDDIYQMSQDTRTSYMDNASQIAKMWQLTDGTNGVFESEEKLLQFNELLNKGFKLGGSGVREINASLYQLTQALSSGRLQGDELRSLAENAPYLINAVTHSLEEMYNEGKDQSEWVDLTYADLKKLGAQGVLTPELIVNAVLKSTDKIREAYENLTPTFEETFQVLKNQAEKIATPALKKLNEALNSEGFEKFAQVVMKSLAIVVTALTPVLDLIIKIGEYMADHWSVFEPIIWGIVGALIVFKGIMLISKAATWAYGWAHIFASLAIGHHTRALAKNEIAMGKYNKLLPITTGVTKSFSAALKILRTGSIAPAITGIGSLGATLGGLTVIIGGVILAVYLLTWAYNKFTGESVSATGIIVGSIAYAVTALYNMLATLWNIGLLSVRAIIAGIGWIVAVVYDAGAFITNLAIKTLGFILGANMAFVAILQNLFGMLWNFFVEFAIGVANIFITANDETKIAFGKMAKYVLQLMVDLGQAINGIFDAVIGSLVSMINEAFGMVNSLIDTYNATGGKLFGEIEHVGTLNYEPGSLLDLSGVEKALSTANEWADGKAGDTPLNPDDYKVAIKDIGAEFSKGYHQFDSQLWDYQNPNDVAKELWVDQEYLDKLMLELKDPSEAYDKWYDKGKGFADDTKDYFKGLDIETFDDDYLKDLGLGKELYENSLPEDPTGKNAYDGGGLTPEAEDGINKLVGSNDRIADNTDMSDEELKYLRDIAHREVINRFTTAEIRITNKLNNQISSDVDLDGMMNMLTNELYKAAETAAEQTHY